MSDDRPAAARWCPSARCEAGAVLLGVVGADGVVGYLSPRLTIDADFVREAHRGRAPEKRFRFAQPCVRERCAQWTGSRCGVIDRVMDELAGTDLDGVSRARASCVLRRSCRWFAQVGLDACAVCPLVITDLRPADEADRVMGPTAD